MTGPSKPSTDTIGMGVASAAAVAVACGVMIASGARTAVQFLVPGALGPSAPLIRADFGPASVPAHRTGYDGQQFYAIARFFPHLHQAARFLDLPRYRLLRIGAPAIAALGGRGARIIWILLALNIVGVGLSVGAVASIAAHHGRPQWIAYFAMVPLLEGVLLSTSEPFSLGLALLGVAFADRHHHSLAIGVLTASALVRESGAVVAVACGVGLALGSGRPRWRTVAGYLVPGAVLSIWWVALLQILGGIEPLSSRFQLCGFLRASSPSIVVALLAMATSAVGIWYWRAVAVVWPVVTTFGLWMLVYNVNTSDWLALPRTAAPAIALGLTAVTGLAASSAARYRPCGPARPADPST